jgi:hypothetical protein
MHDSAMVLETLSEYARLGLTEKNIGADPKFTWLGNDPCFKDICRRLEENTNPVSLAMAVIPFPDTGYLAEDLDFDKQGNSFLFSSVLRHAIFRLAKDGSCRPFASSPSGWPMMAIKIDPLRGWVWATEVAMPGFDGQPDTITGRSAVCCFDLRTGNLRQRFPAPEGAQWADMVLDASGDPIVSDGQSGAILRLGKGTWQRLDHGDFISPQTIALTRDGKSLIVPDYVRGLAIMDIATGSVSWIPPNPGQPCALSGIDGVYRRDDKLLMTQNGVDPPRVVQLQLNRAGRGLAGCTIIEKATKHLGEPTHGVFVGSDFYFIANSGWDALDQHGKLLPGARMTPPTLMRYSAGSPIP